MRMDLVMNWAKEYGIIVIEDCAQALGAKWKGKEVGTFGDYAVASAVKNLYSVTGGILVGKLNDNTEELSVKSWVIAYKRLKKWLEKRTDARIGNIWNMMYRGLLRLKDTRDDSYKNTVHRVPLNVEQEIREALGHIDELQALRTRNAERLMAQIDQTKYRFQQVPEGGESTRNRVIVVALHREAREVIEALRAKGIAANNLTQSYTHPYQEYVREDKMIGKYYTETLPNYERIMPKVVSLPCSPSLSPKEVVYIAHQMNQL